MNPYKAKNVYEDVAGKLPAEKEDIKLINQFYWKYLRSALSSLSNPVINITGLGNMEIKHWKIGSTISKLENKVTNWSQTTTGSIIYDNYTADLEKVKTLRNLYNQEMLLKQGVKLKKQHYEDQHN